MKNKQLCRDVQIRSAILPVYATTGHATTATEVNATGFSRACWIIHVGAMDALAKLEMEVQETTVTSGTFSDLSGAALTDIASTAGKNKIYIIDHPISQSKPFLKIAGTCGTARATVAATCLLYNGSSKKPPTLTVGQLVAL